MNNKELSTILPDVKKVLDDLNNNDFKNYEDKLSHATDKAIQVLENIIDDGTLGLDPEQTVKAVQVMTKAKVDILESKRRLIETCVKGEVMIKALNQPKENKNESSVLLEYLQKNNLNPALDETGTSPKSSSIFEAIAQNQGE